VLEEFMRTTVTLDEAMVSELMKLSGAKNKTTAVSNALREYIRRAKLEQLASLLGKIQIDEQAIARGDQADLKRTQWLDNAGDDNDR